MYIDIFIFIFIGAIYIPDGVSIGLCFGLGFGGNIGLCFSLAFGSNIGDNIGAVVHKY